MLFLSPPLSFCLRPLQSGKAVANCLTSNLTDNTLTETDDSDEL